ncbi:MAG TPA: 3-deoxy-D-manno-octulosonate 8-phosphate phosphatase [Gammaproteobacteria bacterium]|nr:3-deoxy-D-manno-octulosonate 8-phosphate phosphatase [Gammaproteobacteria bacterium]
MDDDNQLTLLFSSVKATIFDFDGVFTDNKVYVDQNGVESVCCWRSDGLGLQRLKRLGIQTLIVSTEKNPVVTMRAQKLGVDCMQGVDDKAGAILEWSNRNHISLSQVCFVGNDINDIPALKKVGIPVGVRDSYEEIHAYVKYRTESCGGRGAVREVCDLIWRANKEGRVSNA